MARVLAFICTHGVNVSTRENECRRSKVVDVLMLKFTTCVLKRSLNSAYLQEVFNKYGLHNAFKMLSLFLLLMNSANFHVAYHSTLAS